MHLAQRNGDRTYTTLTSSLAKGDIHAAIGRLDFLGMLCNTAEDDLRNAGSSSPGFEA